MTRDEPSSSAESLWASMLPFSLQGDDGLCSVGASGVRVRFADGTERLDGASGLWNVNLGYGNEAIARAVGDALRSASYLSLYQRENMYARRAAHAIVGICGSTHFARVMFSTSGGAANDLVIKLVRQFHVLRGDDRRNGIVALNGCWHGLTFGAFALTSDQLGHRMYGVDRRLVLHVPPNDVDALEQLLRQHGDRIAAIVVEPVLGTGTVPLTSDYVKSLVSLRRQYGCLLVADEVATGFGRTGVYFASHRWPEPPDVLISSKGLTNGTTAAAVVVVSASIAEVFREAGAVLAHGETQAGTPVACAAILATVDEMERLDAVGRAARLSDRLEVELTRLVDEEAMVVGITGIGCMRSLHVRLPNGDPLPPNGVAELVAGVREAGALVQAAPDGIALLPALVYTEDDLTELLTCVRSALAAYAERAR